MPNLVPQRCFFFCPSHLRPGDGYLILQPRQSRAPSARTPGCGTFTHLRKIVGKLRGPKISGEFYNAKPFFNHFERRECEAYAAVQTVDSTVLQRDRVDT